MGHEQKSAKTFDSYLARPYAGNFQQWGSGCCNIQGEVSQREKKVGSGGLPPEKI